MTEEEEIAEILQEYCSDPNYRDIPLYKPRYLKAELWRHQYQMIHWMLKAESNGPIVNDEGEVFYSRIGLQCSPTGIGKTAIALGVANYDVPEPAVTQFVQTTSLNTVILKKKNLPMVQSTIICTDQKILDSSWMNDANTFYDLNLFSVFRFETSNRVEDMINNNQNVLNLKNYIYNVSSYYQHITYLYNNGEMLYPQYITEVQKLGIEGINDYESFIAKKNKELEDLLDDLYFDIMYNMLSQNKVILVTRSNFSYFFKFFRRYRVARFFYDEPQGVVLTSQKLFRDLNADIRVAKMRSLGTRTVPYAEESPFGFIWLISATPTLVAENNDDHYFNSWLYKNDFILDNFVKSLGSDEYFFPEMIKQYVVTLPYSYCLESRPGYESLFNEYTLFTRRSIFASVLTGVFDSDFDFLLENNDIDAIALKLYANGTDLMSIVNAAIQKLNSEIDIRQSQIDNFRAGTADNKIAKARKELEQQRKIIDKINLKIEKLKGSNIVDVCRVCDEQINLIDQPNTPEDKTCLCHTSCLSLFHKGCITPYINSQCPVCGTNVTSLNVTPSYKDGNNLYNQMMLTSPQYNQSYEIDPNTLYNTKEEALMKALGPMKRMHNGREAFFQRQKVLLFVEFSKSDSTSFDRIVKICQQMGYNVMLPLKGIKVGDFSARFPRLGDAVVSQKSADINKDLEKYNISQRPVVWICRSIKDAAGLNFPMSDTLIMYSDFRHKVQIKGRVRRANRVIPCDIFTLKSG